MDIKNITKKEMELLKSLKEIGMQVRVSVYHGDTDTYDIQVKNVYKDNVILHNPNIHDATNIKKQAEKDLLANW